LKGKYKRKELKFGWNVTEEGYFLSCLQKALCWEQSSIPNPACFDPAINPRKASPPCYFLVSPLGQRHHKVDWVLLTHRASTLSVGNQRAAKHKPMDGAQVPELHGDTTVHPFEDAGISVFEGPGHAAFICILWNISSLKAVEAEFLIILMGFILAHTEVRGKFCGDYK